MDQADLAALILRLVVGPTMVAHGVNHAAGGGGLAGTAGWFASLGLRPGRAHAMAAVALEVSAGLALVVGLLTPLAAAAVVGVMAVAAVTSHARNGFFIFRPGQGWEYVAVLAGASVALAALGPGDVSLDAGLGLEVDGWWGAALAAGGGLGGAGVLLAVAWRPSAPG